MSETATPILHSQTRQQLQCLQNQVADLQQEVAALQSAVRRMVLAREQRARDCDTEPAAPLAHPSLSPTDEVPNAGA